MRHTRWLIPASLVLGLCGFQVFAPASILHGQRAAGEVLVLDGREIAPVVDRGAAVRELDARVGERAARVTRAFADALPPRSLRFAVLRVLSPPSPSLA